LNENHAGHVSGNEMSIVGLRRSCAALGRDETVSLQLIRELLERGRLEPEKTSGVSMGSSAEPEAGQFAWRLRWKPELLRGRLRCGRLDGGFSTS